MKWLFTCIILLFGSENLQEENVISWSAGRRLEWTDFMARTPKFNGAAAITSSGLSYNCTLIQDNGDFSLKFEVEAQFYPEKSWYNREVANDWILAHEQLHFDIVECYARQLRKKLKTHNANRQSLEKCRAMYKETVVALNAFQKQYDRETDFSRDSLSQRLWNEKVGNYLKNGIE